MPPASLPEAGAVSSVFPARVVPRKKSGQYFNSLAGFKDYMGKEKHTKPTSSTWGNRNGVKVKAVFSSRNHFWTEAHFSQLGAPADQKASSFCRAGGEAAPSHTHFGRT